MPLRPHQYEREFTIRRPASQGPMASTSEPRVVLRDQLRAYAEVKTLGRGIFGSLKATNQYWPELQGYIRQALSYDHAASLVNDPSAGLLLYYCSLNLAKAELLAVNPQLVFKKRIGHGLSYDPLTGSKMLTDYLTIQPAGVFPELILLRTGHKIPTGFRLKVTDLLCRVPEVSVEIGTLGLSADFRPVRLSARGTDTECWISGTFLDGGTWSNNNATTKYVAQHAHVTGQDGFDSILISSRSAIGPISELDVDALRSMNTKWLSPLLSPYPPNISIASPSLLRSKWVPLPPDLARYALMYYVSSIARYRPSLLATGEARWIFSVFTTDSPLRLLAFALEGITGKHHHFTRISDY